jgi:hypothetical protein
MATFDGVSFEERGQQGKMNPRHGGQTRYIVHKVPGGSSYFTQVTGKEPFELNLPVQGTESNLESLRTKATTGTSATLAYSGGNVTARLVEVAEIVEVQYGGTVFQTQAKFII